MNHSARNSVLVTALACCFVAQAQTASQSSATPAEPATVSVASVCGGSQSYDQLTADERNPPTPRTVSFSQLPLELTIWAAEYDDKPADAKSASSFVFCSMRMLLVGVQISTTGEEYEFLNGKGAVRGGGGDKLPPEHFARLQQLIAELPDDHRRVPPPTRRVTVEVRRNGGAKVRLYDSADLPDSILEMLRLTGARIKVAAPLFKPGKVLPPGPGAAFNLPTPRKDGEAAVSPDGRIAVLHEFAPGILTVYEVGTSPHKIIRRIPEFWQPKNGGYSVYSEFSPDGRYLLVTWGVRVGALLFDTATWQPITDPHRFPQHLKEYLHIPDWKLGIAVTETGETLVWDQQGRRVLSKLPGLGGVEHLLNSTDAQGHALYTEGNAEVRGAAVSPDHKRIAVFAGADNVFKLRLSIFDIRSATRERDLWPVEWMAYPDGQPVWWNDGRWVLAPWSSQFSGKGTGIWDAQTGRYLGTLELSGCDARNSPIADGSRLLQSCFIGDGKPERVLEWSLNGVREQMQSAQTLTAANQTLP